MDKNDVSKRITKSETGPIGPVGLVYARYCIVEPRTRFFRDHNLNPAQQKSYPSK